MRQLAIAVAPEEDEYLLARHAVHVAVPVAVGSPQ